jgi:hypothetical protein
VAYSDPLQKAAYMKRYGQMNAQRIAGNARKRLLDHGEEIRARKRARYWQNAEAERERVRQYAARNPRKSLGRVANKKCARCDAIVSTRATMCNSCYAAYRRAWDKEHKPTGERKLRNKARTVARRAKREGRLKQQPCADCGSVITEMHHHDYAKPYEVVWLCRPCHRKRHKKD